MDKYQNKCVTCLCNDRKLISLHEMSNVLQYIHFTELKSWNGGICWECKNIIIKFYKFKLKVYHVQHHWSKKVEQLNPLTNLGIKVNVPYNYHYNYNDPLIEIPIKEEIENSDYNLSESEEDKIKTEIEFSEHNYVEPIYNIRENLSFDDRDLHETKIETDIPTSSHMIIDRLKNDTDKEYSDVSDKFIKVIRTEDEMIKYREDKRNRHNHKKVQFKCEFCLIGFSLKNNYNDHMRLKHHESIGPYSCHVCNIRFKSMTTLADHNKMHYVYYKCKFCKYITSLQFSMLDHCSEQHDKDAVLKKVDCNVCGLKFSGLNTLKRHQSRSHSTKQKFFCDICKQSFSTKSRIESHMTKHSALIAKKLSYCSKCKIQFKALNVYRNHIMTSAQHSKSIFPCSKCDKVFSCESYLKRHYGNIHVRDAKEYCKVCNKTFMLPCQLRKHNQVHHGLFRSRDHACNVCGKKFFTAAILQNHQLIHSENRSHLCAHCGDTFKQKSALYTHTRLVHKLVGKKRNK